MNTYENELNEGERTYISFPDGSVLAVDYSLFPTVHLKLPNGNVYNVQTAERISSISLFTDGRYTGR